MKWLIAAEKQPCQAEPDSAHGARPCHTLAGASLAVRYAFQQTAKYKKGVIGGKQQNTIRTAVAYLSWTAI